MKKALVNISLLIMVALLIAGCHSEEESMDPPVKFPWEETQSTSSVIEAEPATTDAHSFLDTEPPEITVGTTESTTEATAESITEGSATESTVPSDSDDESEVHYWKDWVGAEHPMAPWIFDNGPWGTISIIDDETREKYIGIHPDAYRQLKNAPWNKNDNNVYTNGNVQTLMDMLSSIAVRDRPCQTYSQMKIDYVCSHMNQYLGDLMWWDVTKILDCQVIKGEKAELLNHGEPYAVLTVETAHQEMIHLYIMNAIHGQAYYPIGQIGSIKGYPIGVENGALVVCEDRIPLYDVYPEFLEGFDPES